MRRLLLQSAAFVRAARRLVKKHPDVGASFVATLELLAEDAFHSSLKTHKLKGELEGSWACSTGYDLRIVFEFVQHEVPTRSCCKPLERTKRFIDGKPRFRCSTLGLAHAYSRFTTRRSLRDIRILTEKDLLQLEDLEPGWSVPVGELLD